MKYEYKHEHEITYSEVDKNVKLGLLNSVLFAQDMMTKYFRTIGSDNYTTKINDNALWVVAKTRINFTKFPKWLDTIKGHSYTAQTKLARVELETTFKDKNDNILFVVNQESCPIDITTRKIRKINTISYPTDMETIDAIHKEPFLKLDTFFEDIDKVYSFNVLATDIDFSNHVNNAVYVRYILNTFPSDFWNDKTITYFEIHYIRETKEGQLLTIFKKEIDIGTIDLLIKDDMSEIIRAKIIYI